MTDIIVDLLIIAIFLTARWAIAKLREDSGRGTATVASLGLIVFVLLSGFIGFRIGIQSCYSFDCFFLGPIGAGVGMIIGSIIGTAVVGIYAVAKS